MILIISATNSIAEGITNVTSLQLGRLCVSVPVVGLSKPLSVRRGVVVGADEGEESPRESIDTSTSGDRPRFDPGRG
ncbi:hypothetical protein [Haloferax massiliensis]|uniref:Uncharacterized protein n=1 Tax=Haloferax massiliensis TaxID=1476858 RepID=A0A0D6JMG4_9EURY|nr:hypothetical protein [Haloferax massiliensis]CQR48793.1 hypothetical protein BN996_00241 [Haloferax massiliensis]